MRSRSWQLAWVVCCGFALMGAARAQLVVQRIYTGPPNINSVSPFSSLVQGADGNFYGTIPSNGQLPYGTAFRLTPRGVYSTLVSFTGTNGKDPEGPLALANDGNMYGTTMTGGQYGFGTLFRITTLGSFQILHHFNGWDTAYPQCALMQASDGYLYGVTMPGSTNSGTIYRATTAGAVTVLTNLSHLSSSTPIDGLVEGADGWFYGVTMNNSVSPTVIGGIFKVAADGSLRSLGYFSDPLLHNGGSRPMCGLTLGPDGLLYGTIGHGAAALNTNNGSVFSMTTDGARTTIFAFGGTNGSNPMTRLRLGSDGALYGITAKGGSLSLGTVFRISTAGQMSILANSVGPLSTLLEAPPLVQAGDGNFYGTAEYTSIKAAFAYRLVAPPQVTASGSPNLTLTLTWNSFLNGAYQVYYKNALTDAAWTALGSAVVATGTSASYNSNLNPSPQRLYQVVLLP